HQSTGVARKSRKWFHVQQFARIALRQSSMGHAKIARQAFPTDLRRVTTRKVFKLLTRRAPDLFFVREASPELDGQVERVGGGDPTESFLNITGAQGSLE